MKIQWTEKAETQLDQIFGFIATDSVFYAHKTIQKIIDRVETILKFPEIGRFVPEYDRKDIREVFVYSYRIIYQIKDKENEIRILTVIHTSRILPGNIE